MSNQFRLPTRRPSGGAGSSCVASRQAAIAGSQDLKGGAAPHVQNERFETRFHIDVFGHSDDGRQAAVVAMVEQLVQLFLGPGGGAFRAQVVEDEQRGFADFVEAFVVRGGAVGVERSPQVIEQVRHDHKKGRFAAHGNFVGDGGCQVGFAAAVSTGEGDPIAWLGGKVASEGERAFEVFGLVTVEFMFARVERVEGLIGVQRQTG